MRVTGLLVTSALTASASDVNTASIDCSSGVPDLDSGVTNISGDECRTQCLDVCTNMKNEADLEKCLTNPAIKGCLFQVSTAEEHTVNYCMNDETSNETKLVVMIRGEDLYVTGQTASAVESQKTKVSEVLLSLETSNTSLLSSCANKNVSIGLSSVGYDSHTCALDSNLAIKKSFTISGDGKSVLIPIGDALAGLWGQKDDAVVVIKFDDSTCPFPDVDDAEAYFSISYQAGYVDTEKCQEITDCYQCKVANCHWCSWSKTVDTVLPDWLPDWDWVEEAHNKAKGRCGLSSAMCKISTGSFDTCGVAGMITSSLALGAAYFLF